MKILSLCNCPLVETQGSGYIAINFARHMRARGHEVVLVGPERLEPLRSLRRGVGYKLALGFAAFALRETHSRDYDVVSLCGGESWLAAALLARRRGRRGLLIAHTNGIEPHANEVVLRHLGSLAPDGRPARFYHFDTSRLNKIAFTSVDAIVTLSEYERNYAIERGYQTSQRVVAIEPCLPDEYLNVPYDSRPGQEIGFCGTWIARKGIETLRLDLKRILREFPGAQVTLIGVGGNGSRASVFGEDVRERVKVVPFVGARAELGQWYRRLGILVVPSVYESFGLVTAEAMAFGCCVVTTATGFGWGLRDGEEVVLMKEPRSPFLYEAVRRLLLEPELRERVARGGWRRVQELRWSHAAQRLEAALASWLLDRTKAVARPA